MREQPELRADAERISGCDGDIQPGLCDAARAQRGCQRIRHGELGAGRYRVPERGMHRQLRRRYIGDVDGDADEREPVFRLERRGLQRQRGELRGAEGVDLALDQRPEAHTMRDVDARLETEAP